MSGSLKELLFEAKSSIFDDLLEVEPSRFVSELSSKHDIQLKQTDVYVNTLLLFKEQQQKRTVNTFGTFSWSQAEEDLAHLVCHDFKSSTNKEKFSIISQILGRTKKAVEIYYYKNTKSLEKGDVHKIASRNYAIFTNGEESKLKVKETFSLGFDDKFKSLLEQLKRETAPKVDKQKKKPSEIIAKYKKKVLSLEKEKEVLISEKRTSDAEIHKLKKKVDELEHSLNHACTHMRKAIDVILSHEESPPQQHYQVSKSGIVEYVQKAE